MKAIMLNCTFNGSLVPIDDTKFSEPMPFVGVYIASATLLCAIAMLADLIHGIWNKQYWIPSRYFSLNAFSLTILGVAIKLSVDLTAPMPGQLDQLAKLGTSAFLLIAIITFTPSSAKLEKKERLGNIVGLLIVVITSVVNICIQIRTYVFYLFCPYYVAILINTVLVMIDISFFGTYQRWSIRSKYERLHQRALRESLGDRDRETVATEKLKEYLINFTLIAYSGCSHYIRARRPLACFARWLGMTIPALDFLGVFLTHITEGKYLESMSCNGESDYRRSILGILITQIIAVVVAFVIASVRMVYICGAHLKASRVKDRESPERQYFWMDNLDYMHPCSSYIRYRHPVFIVLVKTLSYWFTVGVDFINLVFYFPVIALWKILLYLIPSVSSNCGSIILTASTSHPDLNFTKLRPYVLACEGEEALSEMFIESGSHVTRKYINEGRRREPKHLIELLDKYMSHDFGGVVSFDRDEVPPLSSQGSPPNCWTLPVVALTGIAIALPNVDHNSIGKLVKSVKESLLYVNLIEDNFGYKHDLNTIRAAASVAWAAVDLKRHWFDLDLKKLALQNRSPIRIMESLSHYAEKDFPKMMSTDVLTAIAAHSMYRICQTLLREYQNENNLDRLSERIFEKVCITISDILGACFTNLKRWILVECSRSSQEKGREAAYDILKFFGKTEKIMKIVEQREIPNLLSLDQMGSIDEWHAFLRSA